MDIEKVKSKLNWDFKFEDEFKGGRGYTFIIDVSFNKPQLALYRYHQYGSKSEPLEKQPPEDMLEKALQEQGINDKKDGLYYVNNDLHKWVEDKLLETT